MLEWELEEGIRLQHPNCLGSPHYLPLPDGRGRLYSRDTESRGEVQLPKGVVSAITNDGLNFEFEPGYRMPAMQGAHDSGGLSAAEVILPATADDNWSMAYSAWQDVPLGTKVPPHPSQDPSAVDNGLAWGKSVCAVEGERYDGDGLDAVHAQDMSLIEIGTGFYRMYYAACDREGHWRITSAVSAIA